MPISFCQTDVGKISIIQKGEKITNLYFSHYQILQDLKAMETPLLKEASQQLESYFAGKLKNFSLPLDPAGTTFMKEVWTRLCEIPFGQTASYKEIAIKVGSPKAARAVGLANNRNPIPLFIPCHRVIGADGSLTGFRGGLELKKRLLELERSLSSSSIIIPHK